MINLIKPRKKPSKILYLYFVLIFLCAGTLFLYQQAKTKKAISNFARTYNITQNDIRFQDKSVSFLGNNLIFYNVIFPEINASHQIDKVIISKQQNSLKIRLIGVNLDVISSLMHRYNIHILNTLKNYQPVLDVFEKPLQTLALANIDTLKFNADFTLSRTQKAHHIQGHILANKLFEIHFRVKSDTTQNNISKLTHLFNKKVQPEFFHVKDKGFFKKYDAYLNSIQLKSTTPERSFFQKDVFSYNPEKSGEEIDLRDLYKLKKN